MTAQEARALVCVLRDGAYRWRGRTCWELAQARAWAHLRLSAELVRLRRRAGLSQPQLAALAGLSTSAVGHAERGMGLTRTSAVALLQALGAWQEASDDADDVPPVAA